MYTQLVHPQLLFSSLETEEEMQNGEELDATRGMTPELSEVRSLHAIHAAQSPQLLVSRKRGNWIRPRLL